MRIFKLALLYFAVGSALPANAQTFPSSSDKVPNGWSGPIFQLSQSYPKTLPTQEQITWTGIDFNREPQRYVQALYNYVLEGNIEANWVVQKNKVRKWYHAPWMHYGNSGREFIHGMTRERSTPAPSSPGKGELGPDQVHCAQNWAVGFFNAPGGFQIGRVWSDPKQPNANLAQFPEGTVVAKLLFTSAPVQEVPYLKNALEWQANVHVLPEGTCPSDGVVQRKPQALRLLQIDLAVKDMRAVDTGWVFATMTYNGSAPGTTVWERMEPVGVMWGNKIDSEQWINSGIGTPQHLGYQGRLNGPVDNPRSSCISCHATAQTPVASPMIAPPGTDSARWFKNYSGTQPFDPGSIPTDYSLQLSMGIQNQRRSSTRTSNFSTRITATEIRILERAFDSGRELPAQIKVGRQLEYAVGR